MIQEINVILRKQTPTAPNEWLYQSTFESRDKEIINEEGVVKTITEKVEVRNFVASVYLGANTEPWKECTNKDKLDWEEKHKEEKTFEANNAAI